MKTPISCDECRAQLAFFLDESEVLASPKIAAHLRNCAACRIEYSMLKNMIGEVRALPHFSAPNNLRARVRAQIEAETSTQTSVQKRAAKLSFPRFRIPRPRIPRWATVSLSGALVTACLLLIVMREPNQFSLSSSSDFASSNSAAQTESRAAPSAKSAAAKPTAKLSTAKVKPRVNKTNAQQPNASSPNAEAPSVATSQEPQSSTRFSPNSNRSDENRNNAPAVSNSDATSNDFVEAAPPIRNFPAQKNASSNGKTPSQSEVSGGFSPQIPLRKGARDDVSSSSATNAQRFAQLELLPPKTTNSPSAKATTTSESTSTSSGNLSRNDAAKPATSTETASTNEDKNRDGRSAFRAPAAAPAPTTTAPAISSAQSTSSTRSGASSNARLNDSAQDSATAKVERRAETNGAANADQTRSRESSGALSQDSAPANTQKTSPSSSNSASRNTAQSSSSQQSSSKLAAPNGATPQNAVTKNSPPKTVVKSSRDDDLSADSSRSRNARDNENHTIRRARLTILPRRDIAQARLQVKWLDSSQENETVWSGSARRNKPISIEVAIPVGNKNARVQVSLQSANARGLWTTTDSVILRAIAH